MQNATKSLPSEFSEALSDQEIKTATFQAREGGIYTYAPELDTCQFLSQFPNHGRLSGLLNSSGSSWAEKAYLFYVSDCFGPPLYIQFGSSFEDAYKSFCANETSLKIETDDLSDYGYRKDESGEWIESSDGVTCSFDSEGQPIDTDNVHGFHSSLKLVSLTF